MLNLSLPSTEPAESSTDPPNIAINLFMSVIFLPPPRALKADNTLLRDAPAFETLSYRPGVISRFTCNSASFSPPTSTILVISLSRITLESALIITILGLLVLLAKNPCLPKSLASFLVKAVLNMRPCLPVTSALYEPAVRCISPPIASIASSNIKK